MCIRDRLRCKQTCNARVLSITRDTVFITYKININEIEKWRPSGSESDKNSTAVLKPRNETQKAVVEQYVNRYCNRFVDDTVIVTDSTTEIDRMLKALSTTVMFWNLKVHVKTDKANIKYGIADVTGTIVFLPKKRL